MDFQSFITNLTYDNCCKEMKMVLNWCRVSIEAITKKKPSAYTHTRARLNVTFLYNRKLFFIQTVCCLGEKSIRFTPIVTVVIATASSESPGTNLGPGVKE